MGVLGVSSDGKKSSKAEIQSSRLNAVGDLISHLFCSTTGKTCANMNKSGNELNHLCCLVHKLLAC